MQTSKQTRRYNRGLVQAAESPKGALTVGADPVTNPRNQSLFSTVIQVQLAISKNAVFPVGNSINVYLKVQSWRCHA